MEKINSRLVRNLVIALIVACTIAAATGWLCIHLARRNALTHEAYRKLSDVAEELRHIAKWNEDLAAERGILLDESRDLAEQRLGIIRERQGIIDGLRAEQRRRDEYIRGLEQYRDDRERNDRAIEAVILDVAGRNNIDSPD